MADNGSTFGGYAAERAEQRLRSSLTASLHDRLDALQELVTDDREKWVSHDAWMDRILREYVSLLATLGL